MRKITDNASRARSVLERASAPVSHACEEMASADVARVLSAYFVLEGEVRMRIARGDKIYITIEATALSAKDFYNV